MQARALFGAIAPGPYWRPTATRGTPDPVDGATTHAFSQRPLSRAFRSFMGPISKGSSGSRAVER
jgi:hypothetical protein